MLYSDRDSLGCTMYMVCNDQGLCLIRTSDSATAHFIEYNVQKGVNPELRLRVGGDAGTKKINSPIWTHVRRFSK